MNLKLSVKMLFARLSLFRAHKSDVDRLILPDRLLVCMLEGSTLRQCVADLTLLQQYAADELLKPASFDAGIWLAVISCGGAQEWGNCGAMARPALFSQH